VPLERLPALGILFCFFGHAHNPPTFGSQHHGLFRDRLVSGFFTGPQFTRDVFAAPYFCSVAEA
jgi:hypothetical protein